MCLVQFGCDVCLVQFDRRLLLDDMIEVCVETTFQTLLEMDLLDEVDLSPRTSPRVSRMVLTTTRGGPMMLASSMVHVHSVREDGRLEEHQSERHRLILGKVDVQEFVHFLDENLPFAIAEGQEIGGCVVLVSVDKVEETTLEEELNGIDASGAMCTSSYRHAQFGIYTTQVVYERASWPYRVDVSGEAGEIAQSNRSLV